MVQQPRFSSLPGMRKITQLLGWNRTSTFLMSGFIAIVMLIIIVWRPLAEEYFSNYNPDIPFWVQFDWLLLGIFLVMSLLIMAGANLRYDIWIVMVGIFGGLVIESWGTQTSLWTYYTSERPPLWIIPAWPIASLAIDRITRLFDRWTPRASKRIWYWVYWIVFAGFYTLLWIFTFPTIDKSLTILALITCSFLIITPTNHKTAIITFIAGSGLGYFLERWGTTRECWTYYTFETPPVFAVFAHGLAAVAFWRTRLLIEKYIFPILKLTPNVNYQSESSLEKETPG
ncbi:MAG TPA: hypothetical protein VIO61_10915 [Anaerolineaceae bacterium]